jgi:hypothetical protein
MAYSKLNYDIYSEKQEDHENLSQVTCLRVHNQKSLQKQGGMSTERKTSALVCSDDVKLL